MINPLLKRTVINTSCLIGMLVGFLSNFSPVLGQTIPQTKHVATPEPPDLPSKDPDDYIRGLQYIFYTGDFSFLEKMTGSRGTQLHLPYGVGFNPPGKDNSKELINEFWKATKISKAQCVGIDPARHSKFTVFFDGIQFEGMKDDESAYFLFMTNAKGNWEMLVTGHIEKDLLRRMASDLAPCPLDERGAPEWFLSATPFAIQSPTEEVKVYKPEKSISLFRRLFPQAYAADICTPIRGPVNDKTDKLQCTEYAAQKRPDALCWLRKEGANAEVWDNDARTLGLGIVKVDEKPQVGDIVVWNAKCGGVTDDGHVAIVTYVKKDANGQTRIDVDQSNMNNDGIVSTRENVLVLDCMSFIHEPGIGISPTPSAPNAAPVQPYRKPDPWWKRFWCFINPWCP